MRNRFVSSHIKPDGPHYRAGGREEPLLQVVRSGLLQLHSRTARADDGSRDRLPLWV